MEQRMPVVWEVLGAEKEEVKIRSKRKFPVQ
jgi:hypothetical protein